MLIHFSSLRIVDVDFTSCFFVRAFIIDRIFKQTGDEAQLRIQSMTLTSTFLSNGDTILLRIKFRLMYFLCDCQWFINPLIVTSFPERKTKKNKISFLVKMGDRFEFDRFYIVFSIFFHFIQLKFLRTLLLLCICVYFLSSVIRLFVCSFTRPTGY